MRELHCPACDETIRAENDDEVLRQAAAHAADKHSDLTIDEEMTSKLRSLIRGAH